MLGDRCCLNASLGSHLVSRRDLHLGRNTDLGVGSVLVVILSRLTLSTIVGIIVPDSFHRQILGFFNKDLINFNFGGQWMIPWEKSHRFLAPP